MTRQRLVVLEVLAENPEQHLTAEEIYERVKVENPDIGLATVYRTVQLLLELELIDRINLDDGFIRYEIGSIEEKEHHRYHHLICMRCGKVSAFQDDMLGLPEELFTPIFAISRISGWSAHRIEEIVNAGKIIRPAYKYVGHHVPYLDLDDRAQAYAEEEAATEEAEKKQDTKKKQ